MNAPKPLISIIIPCYNQARFLSDSIESALSQTWTHREIIVINDGSTDNTIEVASRYPDIIFLNQENQGRSSARNTAVAASHGEYLVFLDADDVLLPDALTEAIAMMMQHPECGLVYGAYRLMEEDGSLINCVPSQEMGTDSYYHLLQRNCIGMMATVLWRRDVFQELGGFNPARQACEDYDLYLQIARRYPIRQYSYIAAYYRQHTYNTTLIARDILKAHEQLIQEQQPYVKGRLEYETARKMGIKNERIYFGGKMLMELLQFRKEPKQWGKGALTLVSLLRYSPGILLKFVSKKAGALFFSRTSAQQISRTPSASSVLRRD